MPLRPLGKKVVGELITPNANESLLIQPFASEKKTYAMKVTGIGAGCEQVSIGDVVILPPAGWTRVMLMEDDGPREGVAINEDFLLAVVE